ncbi:acetyltransferase [Litorivicinus sp.]|nr:acetyltransferase [Litorivicinus sp.]MDC1208331.1 acetyltransferase [Litorivicinus sp.]MDC1240115.1 acetyltransferase [Litorivicinus sp.]
MKKSLVIFGAGKIAELAHYYFSNDSQYDVKAFSVDGSFLKSNSFQGRPVVPFEDIINIFPPDDYNIFIAISYSRLNEDRKEKYLQSKNLGYQMPSYVSSKATVLNDHKIGDNCFILEDNTIQPFVSIGNNVTIWSGNHIGHHSIIRDHSFISSHVVVSGGVTLGESCFVGVNATLRDHVSIGPKCVIGAGARILKDANEGSVFMEKATEASKVPSSKLRNI